MDISVIIVNYRSKDKLISCLNSLARVTFANLNWEVVVIENNSGDDLGNLPLNIWSSDFQSRLQIITSQKNLGMGGGNNLGIDKSRGEYLLILNPDTIVSQEAVLSLYNYIKSRPEVGVVGPKLLYPDASLQYSCARFPSFFMPILRRTFLGDYFKKSRDGFMMANFDHNSICEVDWLMGSCLMFKRGLKFDDRYFMYFEDIDLCRQAKSMGLKVVYNPEAIVIHDHQRQSAKNPWYLAIFKDKLTWAHIASWLKYFAKWGLKTKI